MTIRIIDLETTGLDPTAHVVEVGSVDLLPDGSIGKYQEHLIKPPVPIPPEARAVHHISDEDVAQAKPWPSVCSTFLIATIVLGLLRSQPTTLLLITSGCHRTCLTTFR
jgi:DNA polymerase III epsilon subunit-like protein